jgi:hypothetical protein
MVGGPSKLRCNIIQKIKPKRKVIQKPVNSAAEETVKIENKEWDSLRHPGKKDMLVREYGWVMKPATGLDDWYYHRPGGRVPKKGGRLFDATTGQDSVLDLDDAIQFTDVTEGNRSRHVDKDGSITHTHTHGMEKRSCADVVPVATAIRPKAPLGKS